MAPVGDSSITSSIETTPIFNMSLVACGIPVIAGILYTLFVFISIGIRDLWPGTIDLGYPAMRDGELYRYSAVWLVIAIGTIGHHCPGRPFNIKKVVVSTRSWHACFAPGTPWNQMCGNVGGGGGNRTRVRQFSAFSSTCLFCLLFNLPLARQTGIERRACFKFNCFNHKRGLAAVP